MMVIQKGNDYDHNRASKNTNHKKHVESPEILLKYPGLHTKADDAPALGWKEPTGVLAQVEAALTLAKVPLSQRLQTDWPSAS